MRLCSSPTTEFAAVVTTDADSSQSPVDGSRHGAHSPANASGRSSDAWMWNGFFSFPSRRHS